MNGVRAGVRWFILLATGIGLSSLTACTSLSPLPLDEFALPVDGVALAQCYQQDQSLRRNGPVHWGVDGILDLEAPDHARRNRIDLLGTQDEKIRLRAYGPFQQVALELLVAPHWMRWLDPQQQTITQVPATLAGMTYLIGAPLQPSNLFQLLMGWAGPLPINDPVFQETQEGVFVETSEGERVRLDPVQGRLLERFGETVPGRAYHVVYTWPEPDEKLRGELIMPERILITLNSPQMRLEFIFKRWYFPLAGPSETLFTEDVLPGFTLLRPLDGNEP